MERLNTNAKIGRKADRMTDKNIVKQMQKKKSFADDLFCLHKMTLGPCKTGYLNLIPRNDAV